ncbi:MAG: DHH family phosphoesterase [bacterium]|nr:DHH family phosphoesterase [bacterium]
MVNHTHKEILQQIDHAQHVVLVSHRGPDGDTVGSALALQQYIDALGKKVTCYCVNETPPHLGFLLNSEKIGPHNTVWNDDTVDLVIVLDSGDLVHAGVAEYIPNGPDRKWPVICIDHHITNKQYGDFNLINSEASSTCEIVYGLLEDTNAINKDIATCLLTGLITDTGSFSNLATTASSVHTASKLLSLGANLQQIAKHALNYRPYTTLKLWGRALERLHEDEKTGMIVTVITLDDITECNADSEAVSGISNFLNDLEQAAEKAIMVLAQTTPGVIKASLRTTNPLIDVSEFAKLNGGGGHKKAAGFTINGTLEHTNNGYEIINKRD